MGLNWWECDSLGIKLNVYSYIWILNLKNNWVLKGKFDKKKGRTKKVVSLYQALVFEF